MLSRKHLFELAAFVVGILLFWAILRRFGFSEVVSLAQSAGSAAFAVFFFYPFMCFWDVVAWRLLFLRADSPRVRTAELFWIRLAGEALNNVTPVVDVGGEPLKVHLLSKRFGLSVPNAVVSTLVAKTSNVIAEAVFMFVGAMLSLRLLNLPAAQRLQLGAMLLAVCVFFVGFLVMQQRGVFHRLNPDIRGFYAAHGGRFWGAVVFNGAGWALGGVETWLFCQLLGIDLSILQCVMLEGLLQLVRTSTFFIPMNLGSQEGGLAFFFHALGQAPAAGLAISLLKRARQLIWTGAGFVVWGIYQYGEAKARRIFARTDMLSLDTNLDRNIHRPVADVLALALCKTPITPNQVTACTLIPAFLSAAFFAAGSAAAAVSGLVFFYLWSVLDHTDGSLARLKKMTSAWGRWFDDACDAAASTLILCGVFAGLQGVWSGHDRLILNRLFWCGLLVNVSSAFLVLSWKRRVRQKAVESESVSEGLVWKQRFLDRLTGRDAFYLLLVFTVAAHAWGPVFWPLYTFTMGLFIIGLFVVSAVSLREAVRSPKGRKVVFITGLLVLAACFLWPLPRLGNVVRVTQDVAGYGLLVNGKPFYIQGAGVGEARGKEGEDYLALAKELGANVVRTWGTDQGTQQYLDQAWRHGLFVNAGIWVDYVDAKKTVSYLAGPDYRKKKEREALEYVRRFKDHPALFAWNIGNECIFFTKDPAEREALCYFLEELVQKVKKEDPDHPVLYASVNSLDLPYLKKYVPSLDIIGMNVYGSVIGSQSGWQALDFGKPYVITEFGPLGPWDLPKDANGKMLEQEDYTKAQQYRNHWALIKERHGKNVGGFVFHIGETTQESLTQWNLNEHLYRKESFVVMQKLYGAGDASDHAPKIRAFNLPDTVSAGAPFEVELLASDPEGSELSYEFGASTSIQDVLQYYVNVSVEVSVNGAGPKAVITAPDKPGVYRLYGFARDKTGRSASTSRTIQIE